MCCGDQEGMHEVALVVQRHESPVTGNTIHGDRYRSANQSCHTEDDTVDLHLQHLV